MPVAYGHRDVGYVDRVVISCGAEIISPLLEQDDIFDPIHYLPLLERKPRPWTGHGNCERRCAGSWKPGWASVKREFVRVLRLMEDFSHQEVHHAVQDALRLGAVVRREVLVPH